MSKFYCTCGYTIGFNVNPCRYDADVLGEQGEGIVDNTISNEVAKFIASITEGRRNEWLKQFYGEVFPIDDRSVVYDIFQRQRSDFILALHQCEQCGRLWLQEKPGQNVFHSYLPEAAWRGALETPAPGFVGYVDGQNFFNAYVAEVQQESERARVILKRGHAKTYVVTFIGVSAVQQHDRKAKQVRFLSEWKDTPPLRRFVFDSTSQSYEPLLEITAREIHLDEHQEPRPG